MSTKDSDTRHANMPETNFSLINLKGLSEPLGKLIDAVRSAVGIFYEPTQIRRKGRAEADAAVILARNQQEIQDIEIRASERLRAREIRRQKNIEDVTRAAMAALPESVSKDPVDEDWVHEFYEHCQDVGNQQMQQLWGKILSGEVAKPGSYSLRCLRLIKDIQQKDADLFTRFCAFVWDFGGVGLLPIIPSTDHEAVKNAGINFTDFLHLQNIGLIQLETSKGFVLHKVKDTTLLISYFGQKHRLRIPPTLEKLQIGQVFLTSVGEELVPISGSRPSESYRCSVIEYWNNAGCVVEI